MGKAVSAGDGATKAASLSVKQQKPVLLRALIDAHNMSQAMVFCRTNLDCDLLAAYLNRSGGVGEGAVNPYKCMVLAGGKNQNQRRAALAAFKRGECRFLICTDVAARGTLRTQTHYRYIYMRQPFTI